MKQKLYVASTQEEKTPSVNMAALLEQLQKSSESLQALSQFITA